MSESGLGIHALHGSLHVGHMSVWVPSEYSSFLLQSKDVRGVVNGCLSLCINPATDWPPVYPPCWLVTAGIGSALRMMLNWIIRRRWMDGWLIGWRIQVRNFICIQLQVICSLISGPLYRRGSHLTSEYFMHNHDCDCILWINWKWNKHLFYMRAHRENCKSKLCHAKHESSLKTCFKKSLKSLYAKCI